MKCPNCPCENREGARFCESCGRPLGRKCPNCGELLRAEARFCDNCGTAQSAPTSPTLPPSDSQQDKVLPATPALEGERKPVSILFSDIVGSTALAEKLDPEDWRDFVSGVHERISQAVYRYEGTIAQLLGDGVLAFFGAPITHEDDPRRAVHAALDIERSIEEYACSLPCVARGLQIRSGIHTGLVVVGNIGSDRHMEYLAIGDAVNLAARLQSAASPGKVLLSETTARQLGDAFELKTLGEITIKGKAEPVRAFEVTGRKAVSSNGRERKGLCTALTGRVREMTALNGTLEALSAGFGQIVSLIADAGLGKSRLVDEMRAGHLASEFHWLEAHTLSYGQTFSFWAVTRILRADLELSDNDPDEKVRAALEPRVRELFADRAPEVLPYLIYLLGLKLEGEMAERVQAFGAENLKGQLLRSLVEYVSQLARRSSTVLVFEDLHWADVSTIEVIERMLPITDRLPLMLVLVFRPERDHPCWKLKLKAETDFRHRYTEIELSPLSARDSDQLVGQLLNTNELPDDLRNLLWERAEGNPLYVEELFNTLVEQGAIVRQGPCWRVIGDLAGLAVPMSLQELLLARIGRLETDTRATLQLASVIGRTFPYRLLKAVTPKGNELDTHLARLQRADLVRERARRPEVEYTFKHALVQDAAYNSLLSKRRREFHRQVGEALEELYRDRASELAGTFGLHFERAQLHDKAIHYLSLAADLAKERYSNAEAVALYRSALNEVERAVAQNGQLDQLKPQGTLLREHLGDVLALTGRSEEARATFRQAVERAPADDRIGRARLQRKLGITLTQTRQPHEALEEYDAAETTLGAAPDLSAKGWYHEWIDLQNDRMWAYYWEGCWDEMRQLADKVQGIAEKQGARSQQISFFLSLASMNNLRGRYAGSDETVELCRKAASIAEEGKNAAEMAWTQFNLGFAQLWNDELDAAETHIHAALRLAERIGDPIHQSRCLTYLTILYRKRGQLDRTRETNEHALAVASSAHMIEYVATANGNRAWVDWREGNHGDAIGHAQAALELWRQLPAGHASAFFQWTALWPLIAIRQGEGQTVECVDLARQLLEPTRQRLPDLLRTQVESAIQSWEEREPETSRQYFDQAIQLAGPLGYL